MNTWDKITAGMVELLTVHKTAKPKPKPKPEPPSGEQEQQGPTGKDAGPGVFLDGVGPKITGMFKAAKTERKDRKIITVPIRFAFEKRTQKYDGSDPHVFETFEDLAANYDKSFKSAKGGSGSAIGGELRVNYGGRKKDGKSWFKELRWGGFSKGIWYKLGDSHIDGASLDSLDILLPVLNDNDSNSVTFTEEQGDYWKKWRVSCYIELDGAIPPTTWKGKTTHYPRNINLTGDQLTKPHNVTVVVEWGERSRAASGALGGIEDLINWLS